MLCGNYAKSDDPDQELYAGGSDANQVRGMVRLGAIHKNGLVPPLISAPLFSMLLEETDVSFGSDGDSLCLPQAQLGGQGPPVAH